MTTRRADGALTQFGIRALNVMMPLYSNQSDADEPTDSQLTTRSRLAGDPLKRAWAERCEGRESHQRSAFGRMNILSLGIRTTHRQLTNVACGAYVPRCRPQVIVHSSCVSEVG